VTSTAPWPITHDDVRAARERLRPFLAPTPLRGYAELDEAAGLGIRVLVKHENFQPTGAFKVRAGVSLVSGLSPEARGRGLVAASRGNHGLGIAWAGRRFGAPVTICVPRGNNPEKNAGIRALGARLVEEGQDYDEALEVAERVVRETGATLAHSTNDPAVIAGAGTIALEILEEEPALDAMVLAVGGGSQAVGALTVARVLRPELEVYAVQAAGAAATHDSWRAGKVLTRSTADTFADGLATRTPYVLTFDALRAGLADFVTATDGEIAAALRLLLKTTHTLVEGAGAAGLAGLLRLRERLAGKRVAVVLTGANIDAATLKRVVNGEF
jgi:threonine dehydratase